MDGQLNLSTEEHKEMLVQFLRFYVVGLFGLSDAVSHKEPQYLGSGTLVQCGELYGILTASHVLDAGTSVIYRNSQHIGLTVTKGAHKFTIEKKALNIVPICNATYSEWGPDIAFAILPPSDVSIAKNHMSFWNINRSVSDLLAEIEGFLDSTLVFLGSPGEWVDVLPSDGQFKDIKRLTPILIESTKGQAVERSGYDYIDIPISANETGMPESFGGVSGAGLWIVPQKAGNGVHPIMKDPILFGIVFYEIPKDGGLRIIRSHGPNTVYRNLVAKLRD